MREDELETEIQLYLGASSWGMFYDPNEERAHYAEICDAQCADVFWAWYFARGTVEQLSVAVYLPVWTVQRRLHELGLGPEVRYAQCRRFGN